jgi:hypothetical protein
MRILCRLLEGSPFAQHQKCETRFNCTATAARQRPIPALRPE